MDHVLPLVSLYLVSSMYDFLCLSCFFLGGGGGVGSKAVDLDSLSFCG